MDYALLAADSRSGAIMFGALAGVLGTAACYLFFIWLAIRDRSQIFLIIMLFALLASLGLSPDAGTSGLSVGTPLFTQFCQYASLLAFYVASGFFTINFLDLASYSPFTVKLIKSTIGSLVVTFLLLAVNTVFFGYFMPSVGIYVCAVMLFAGLQGFVRRVPGSGTHMLAFALLIAGGLVTPLAQLGVVSINLQSINIFYISSAAAALVFAIGIARQFSIRQEEKERQLSLSNERFALAAAGSNEGLFDWNLETKRAYFSDRFKKLVGRDLEQSEEGIEQWMQMVDTSQQDRIRHTLKNFMKGDAVAIDFEYRVRRPDGNPRWLYTSGVALRDPRNGNVRRLVGSTGDITERKQAEHALKDSESRFRSIIEAHPVPVVIISLAEDQFMYASPSVADLLGISSADLVGRMATDFVTDVTLLRNMIRDLNTVGHVEGREVQMRHRDGHLIEVALSARIIDYQKRPAAVIGLHDLTERKEAQAQIEHQRIALEQSEKLAALGSLLAGVAHELNNPLSVVVGQSTLLFEGSSDPKIQTRADKIRKAAERCTRIVRNFLALARRKDPERKAVDLNQTINQAFELLAPQMRSDDVDVTFELAADLPPVMADTDQLHQIFTNLVLNAKQALVEQPVPRHVTIRTSTDPVAKTVMLRVSDNGPGVPPDLQRRIFEPFFTTKKEGRGTGIGLSLSLGLAEAHGGSVTYETTPGGGATFVLNLPIGEIPVAAPADAAVDAAPVTPLNILLVDDEPDVMQVLGDLLGSDGHHITQAENGAAGLEKLKAGNFDLVISDLRMPVMDGPTLYHTIVAELPRYANRIFFVTGDTLSTHVRAFLEENPVLVIDKPYMPDDVRQAVRRQLRIAQKVAEQA